MIPQITQIGMVTHGLLLLPNSLKQRWRQLMVEKITVNSLVTALVDIPAVIIASFTLPQNFLSHNIVLCDKTAHFSGLLLSRAQGAPV
jgi:hypothetical protein